MGTGQKAGAVALAAVLLCGCAADKRTRDAQMAIGMTVILAPVLMAAGAGKETPMPDMPVYSGDDVPLTRGVIKPPAIVKAEAEFVRAAERAVGSKFSAAYRLRQLGSAAFYQHDFRTATRRYNQSLLLDDTRDEAYDGLARIAWARDHDAAFAEALFKMAMAHIRTVPDVEVHYAGLLIDVGRPAEALTYLRAADAGPSPPFAVRPLLVIALDMTHDHAAACAEAAKPMAPFVDDTLRAEVSRRTADCPR